VSYEEVRAKLALTYGWTFDSIDGMSFDQIASALRHGKRKKGVPVSSDDDVRALARQWRRFLPGLI
jgi:hypothetical protein